MAKRITNLGSYSGPTLSAAISARHLRVTLRNSGDSKNCMETKRIEGCIKKGGRNLRDLGVGQ